MPTFGYDENRNVSFPKPDLHAGQTHERAYALNRRSVWPKNTNWGLIGAAFHKFPTFIARIRRVNSIIFLYKDFMRLPWTFMQGKRMKLVNHYAPFDIVLN